MHYTNYISWGAPKSSLPITLCENAFTHCIGSTIESPSLHLPIAFHEGFHHSYQVSFCAFTHCISQGVPLSTLSIDSPFCIHSQVTRLGKLINLIRRKVVEVDKQLAKRLKKLVRQWQQLLVNRAPPNGIMPSQQQATPTTQSTPSVPANSSQATAREHAPFSVQTTPTISPSGTGTEQLSLHRTSTANSLLSPPDLSLIHQRSSHSGPGGVRPPGMQWTSRRHKKLVTRG